MVAYHPPTAVDVGTVIEIDRPRTEVAAFASGPDNATIWYENIVSVEWETAPPLAVGSRLAFVARFLGRRLAYTYRVEMLDPGERLVMRTAQRPFSMETTYRWEDTATGATRMRLRDRGGRRASSPRWRRRRWPRRCAEPTGGTWSG